MTLSSMRLTLKSTEPPLERAADGEARLPAFVRGVTGIANAVVFAIKAAEAEAPIADRQAVPTVDAPQAVVAALELEIAAGDHRWACE